MPVPKPIATIPTFFANIYVGLQQGYDGPHKTVAEAREICQIYCDDVKLGLTLTPTEFIYVNGCEPGVVVGLINYPRFPKTNEEVEAHALTLGELLMKTMNQYRVSVMTNVNAHLLENSAYEGS